MVESSWARWRPEIVKAIDPAFHSIDDIEREITESRSQLWMTSDFCVITQMVNYPGERVCQCLWAAGDLARIINEFEPYLAVWARSQGCASILVESRAGWARALKPSGYKPWSVTVRKAL